MRLMLDTHILLWALSNDERLPQRAAELINDESNEIFYSPLSFLEVELKLLKHPETPLYGAEGLEVYCDESGFYSIPFDIQHTFQYRNLWQKPNAPSHKDPFDRAIIAQAKSEGMLLLTHDRLLATYDEPCVFWV